MLWKSNKRIIRYFYSHLEWPPRIKRFISFKEGVPEGSDCFQQTLGRAHTRRNSTHNKKKEYVNNWRSRSDHPKKNPQVMRNMKNSTLEETLIHLIICIRNYVIMNEEDDEAQRSRRSLPTKQIKTSIKLSFHNIVLLCNCLYSVNVLCMIECLH